MPHEMRLRGVPALAVQLARRKTADGRDQLIMRVESPLEEVAHLTEVALAVLRLNHYLGALLSGNELPLPLIEVYRPGELRTGQLKLPAFVDESHLAAIEGSAKRRRS